MHAYLCMHYRTTVANFCGVPLQEERRGRGQRCRMQVLRQLPLRKSELLLPCRQAAGKAQDELLESLPHRGTKGRPRKLRKQMAAAKSDKQPCLEKMQQGVFGVRACMVKRERQLPWTTVLLALAQLGWWCQPASLPDLQATNEYVQCLYNTGPGGCNRSVP